MGKALYRKYRSKKLSEVVGQEHITDTLKKALEQKKISHAYLFTGPRGVGKTSVARILAHELNMLPYDDDTQHIDIIEIDAASNRRIDEIRELREKVYVAPAQAPYKVYIIDEVHMLTREAFNALLKTLEEPPAHVVFILATTDAHKLPETIVSRTQRFTFKPVPADKVITHLRFIAQSEKIKIDDEALALLAEHGEGSFRDSISLLDQASSYGTKITGEDIRQLLGVPPKESIQKIVDLLPKGNSAEIMQLLTALYDDGYAPVLLAKELGSYLRTEVLGSKNSPADDAYLTLLENLLAVPGSPMPGRLLEITLLKFASQPSQPTQLAAAPASTKPHPPKPLASKPTEKPQTKTAQQPPAAKNEEPPAEPTPKPKTPTVTGVFDLTAWPLILDTLKKRYNTLYGVIRMAEPEFVDESNLQLTFAFAFHQKRINEPANRQILGGIIKEVTGHTVHVECLHNKNATPPKLAPQTPAPTTSSGDPLDTISNIFGGGELLES